MLTKSMVIEKMDDSGKGLARIAQLSAIDSDGDTYAPGAFSWKQDGGQWLMMIPAHNRQAMPFGKAWLYEKDDWALADLNLNLNTQAGKEWYETLKFDLATGQPVQQWSYGFRVLDAQQDQRGGDTVRVLKKLDCDEISPVLRGAGVGTGTLAIKSAELKEAHFAPLIADLGLLADAVRDGTAGLSATGLKQLGDIHAALGMALDPRDEAALVAANEDRIQAAIGGWLEHMSRGHLRG